MWIKVSRILPNKLEKHIYSFEMEGEWTLRYIGFDTVRRSNRKEQWADMKKDVSFANWKKRHNLTMYFDEDDIVQSRWKEYQDKHNPVLQKTRQGEPKWSGVMSDNMRHLPPCPDNVAREAVKKCMSQIKVEYKSKASLSPAD